MFPDRSLRRDLLAIALLAFVIFLIVALVTYDRADPIATAFPWIKAWYRPDNLVYPHNSEIRNSCGVWGALAADVLLNGLGIGAYFLLLALVCIDWKLLRRIEVDTPVVRLLGLVVSIVGLATLAAILAPNASPGPMIGSGGYVGALTLHRMQTHFAVGGSVILALSMFVGGLFIWADYAVIRWSALTVAGTVFGLAAGRDAIVRRMRINRKDADDEESDEDLSVRFRAKKRTSDLNSAPERHSSAPKTSAPKSSAPSPQVDDRRRGPASTNHDLPPTHSPPKQRVREPAESESAIQVKHKPKSVEEAPHPPAAKIKKRDIDRESVMTSLDKAAVPEKASDYELPQVDMLIPGDDVCYEAQATEVRRKAKILEKTFGDFGFQVKVVEIETGPVIAQYEVELEAGLRLSKITGLADDLAIALRVPSVRIVAPIPGKNTVGIEVPNEVRQVVRLREVIEEGQGKTKKAKIPLFLGKDVSGAPLIVDLATLPHLLIAGRTGTGKSVCLNAIICSMLMTRRPDEVRLLMIDPKMVELSGYSRLPHLMHPVVTDMRKAEAILAWAVEKMEERYALLARAGVRHITSYNQLGEEELMERLKPENDDERKSIPQHLPFIVIVADEMADLMMTAGKEVEQHIIRLAQKSRAVGIHLILATQKPTVDVITGLIKSNLPARIAFQVASRTDSRVVLDEMGADKLLGNGDMLFLWPGTSSLLRGQGTYLSDEEINSIVDCVSTGEPNYVNELMNLKVERGNEGANLESLKQRDDLYESAVDLVVREGRGSVSLLQRALGIGYGRAARLIDYMSEDGIVGTYNGSQAREVLISLADWERMQGIENGENSEASAEPVQSKSRKISMSKETVEPNSNRATKPPSPAKDKPRIAQPIDELDEDLDYNEEDVEDDATDEQGDLWKALDEDEEFPSFSLDRDADNEEEELDEEELDEEDDHRKAESA